MNDYLAKPITPEELIQKLEMWMQAPYDKTAKATEATSSTGQFEDFSPFDYSSLLERMLGDEQLVRGVIDLFLTEIPKQLEQLSASIDNHDFETSDKLAHKLAGGLANLSINRMHAITKEIQHQCKNHNIEPLKELLSLLDNEFKTVQHTLSRKKADLT